MGFIGYIATEDGEGGDSVIRIFLECQAEVPEANAGPCSAADVSYTYAIDVLFPTGGGPCRISGVSDVLSLKKFYKLVHSLEERAREHGHARQQPLNSADGLLEHLGYTRNARDLSGARLAQRR